MTFYFEIDQNNASFCTVHNVLTVSGIAGVKYPLFDEYLVHDTRYIFLSTIFILVCVWLYTGCVFITFLTITAIFFSLINAYFVYTFVFGLNFFPFMNILAVIVSLGKFLFCFAFFTAQNYNSKSIHNCASK